MTIATLFAAAAAAAASNPDIVVSASLDPVPIENVAGSITIIDEQRIEALGQPFALDLIRLAPGISVSSSGGQGSLTQIRIRGAEANHSLVFIDGIAFNDPASGNQARFESFISDGLGKIEILRGPQSAIWGSEALGGVIAMETLDPTEGTRAIATGEYGTHDFGRASIAAATGDERGGVSATASYLRSDGIDILGGGRGDRDGFNNFTTSLKAVARPSGDGEIGIVGRYIRASNRFDGSDPFTFQRADTADASRAETGAVRAWATLGLAPDAPWSFKVEGQYLDSANRNRLGAVRTNDTRGDRFRVSGQLGSRFDLGGGAHELIAFIEREDESFENIDISGGGASNSRNTRGRTAFIGEWRGNWWGDRLVTDIAVRQDQFNRFRDATTVRGSALVKVVDRLGVYAAYNEGIAQPSFTDLFGFSPGSGFVGNPDLRPERSQGYEAGVRWASPALTVQAALFSSDLRDEILEDFATLPFPAYTVVNAPGKSRRRGFELSGEWRPVEALRLAANYGYTNSRERRIAGPQALREIRRPKNTANLAADYVAGAMSLGASVAYVGKRVDSDFDLFPAPRVTLKDYALIGARIGYRLTPAIELFGRADNLGGAHYQDVIGYATPGRTVQGGVRVRFNR